ncbi:GntR family transcriptional regulator [Jatrophihabitans fulvus]
MDDPVVALDATSPVPPFEQIRGGLAGRIAGGELPAGTKLPTVRALAAELEVATNTVARAYRELETAGLIETRGRAGTVVRATSASRQELAAAAARLAELSAAQGLSDDDAVAQLRAALDARRT